MANTFLPTRGLPDGLRQVAEWSPLAWCALLLSVTVPLAIARYRRAIAR